MHLWAMTYKYQSALTMVFKEHLGNTLCEKPPGV